MVPAVVSLSLAAVLAAVAVVLGVALRRRAARADAARVRLAALVARADTARRERAALAALSGLDPELAETAEAPEPFVRPPEPDRLDVRRPDVRRRPHGLRPPRAAPDPLPPARP